MKHEFYYKLLFIVVLLCGENLLAQEVTGVVSDENGTLPGVNIIVKGTTVGATTDFDGNYTIENVDTNAVLVFSMIGYSSQETAVNGNAIINVVLVEDLLVLDEVVLIGYSERKKSSLTAAVATVDLGEISKVKTATVAQSLQGQIAGVQVTSNSGAPGAPIEVRIRGVNTIGNNNPLYVVDGIPSRDISFLNQSDIGAMTVLKDAAAAAIYGARASNGVVIITTKKGRKGKTGFDLDVYYGIQNVSNLPDMMNTEQYMDTYEKAWNNTYTGDNPYTADKGRSDFADTDWLDELFETGKQTNINFATSGGNEKVQFLMSLGYFGQDGIVVYDNDRYERLNFRTNLNIDITDRFKIGTNLSLSQSTQDKTAATGESLIRFALLRAPVISVFKDVNDPTYTERDPYTDMPFFTPTDYDQALQRSMYEMVGNPIAQAYFTDDQRKIYKTFGNVFGEFAFLENKELKFRTNFGIDLNFFHNKAFNENYGDDDGGGAEIDRGQGRRNRPNSLNEDRGEDLTYTWNNTLSYSKTFDEHHDFYALIGTEYITNYRSWIGATRARYPYTTDNFRYIDYGGGELDVWNNGSASEWTLFSYFATASYAFKNKYLVTANVRADASSRFAEANRWGYFPSVSAGWKITEEEFLRDVDWLSNLKLRASWGELGNQEIDNYAYLTLISQESGIVKTERYGNPDLKWESTAQTDIGIDVGFFNNKLLFTMDYFSKKTKDILLPIGLPSVVGDVSPTILNAGEVSNSGFEFTINYRNSENAFKYSINANLSTLTNNVDKLHPNLPNISTDKTRTEVGHPLNAYYGYKMIGIYQNQAEIDAHLLSGSNAKPGDIKFEDINDDGKITPDFDRDFIGSPIPDITYGLSFSGSIIGFDFSIFFQGVEGIDRYNDGKKITDFDTRPFNMSTAVLGAWDGEGSTNSRPRVAFEDVGSSKVSSLYVEDASYFRLKNLEVGYSLEDLKGIDNLRFYISGQNLFTITDYTGLDPELTDLVDLGTYPPSTTFLLGVNFKF